MLKVNMNIKNRTNYFFNDMINIEKFDSSLPKIDKKSYKKFTCIVSDTSNKKI